jgi:DNA-binding CsgD family transcriptional regulator
MWPLGHKNGAIWRPQGHFRKRRGYWLADCGLLGARALACAGWGRQSRAAALYQGLYGASTDMFIQYFHICRICKIGCNQVLQAASYWVVILRILGQLYLMEMRQNRLTARELEILKFLALGESCREIGAKLGVSYKTIECHRAHIMEKLEANEISAVVRYAIRNGLIVA